MRRVALNDGPPCVGQQGQSDQVLGFPNWNRTHHTVRILLFLAVQGKHDATLDINKERDPSARVASTWEPARKCISRPDSASLQYSLHEGVNHSAWAQKRSCTSCLPRFKGQGPIDTLPSIALAWHPVHRILVSGGSEGAILHWDLSSPSAGTPPKNPTAPSSSGAATSPASYTALSAPAPQIPPRARLSQAHDSNVSALTFDPLVHVLVSASNEHMTHFWARERPADAAPARHCPARRHAYRCVPRR